MRWRSQFRDFARGRIDASPVPGNAVFEEFIDAKKIATLKALGSDEGDPGRAKRTARAVVRTITNEFRERPRGSIPRRLLAFRHRTSRLIEVLAPTRDRDWLRPLDRAKQGSNMDIELAGFSILESPDDALDCIRRLVKAESGAWEVQVHFDDPLCQDIAPYLVLAMAWRDLAPIFTGGRMTREIQRVVEAVQLRRPLQMGRFRLDGRDHFNLHAFPLHQRRPANTSTSATRHLDPQSRERVQDGLVRSMNEWLEHPQLNRELTPVGRSNIKNIVGEILDNAERHSVPETMDGDWTVAGFMARRGIGQGRKAAYFQCSIAFVSIGSSISDSLATSPPVVAAEVERYVARHRGSCDVDVLRTVMSIQDGITRVSESVAAGRGGTGFQDVFDLVSDLGTPHNPGCEPKVTIVSGNACLKLHGRHALGSRAPGDPYAPRQIWFNDANDPSLPPVASHAFRLRQPFPGTLVTMSFVFTPEKTDGEAK